MAGIAAGLAAVVGLSQWMKAFLFGVPALDAVTLVSAAAILVLTMIVATLAPAWRAARVDAVTIIRSE